jgi:hypothetical protein
MKLNRTSWAKIHDRWVQKALDNQGMRSGSRLRPKRRKRVWLSWQMMIRRLKPQASKAWKMPQTILNGQFIPTMNMDARMTCRRRDHRTERKPLEVALIAFLKELA